VTTARGRSGDPLLDALNQRWQRCIEAMKRSNELHGPTDPITLVCAEATYVARKDYMDAKTAQSQEVTP
jgi:hypothetical protein